MAASILTAASVPVRFRESDEPVRSRCGCLAYQLRCCRCRRISLNLVSVCCFVGVCWPAFHFCIFVLCGIHDCSLSFLSHKSRSRLVTWRRAMRRATAFASSHPAQSAFVHVAQPRRVSKLAAFARSVTTATSAKPVGFLESHCSVQITSGQTRRMAANQTGPLKYHRTLQRQWACDDKAKRRLRDHVVVRVSRNADGLWPLDSPQTGRVNMHEFENWSRNSDYVYSCGTTMYSTARGP